MKRISDDSESRPDLRPGRLFAVPTRSHGDHTALAAPPADDRGA